MTNLQSFPLRVKTPEASRFTGVSASTLTKYRVFGGGPEFIKIGRSVYYETTTLNAWVAKHRRISTSDWGLAAA